MTKVIQAPHPRAAVSPAQVNVFLAGSIEMGKAVDWQTTVGEDLSLLPCIGNVFNPRRTDWDSSWIQSIDNEQFFTQVNWELDHIETGTVVFFHFEPGTQSPITLAELGYVLGRLQSYDTFRDHLKPTIVVNCPDGFWRQGNVEIMCHRAGIKIHRDLEDAKKTLVREVWSKHKILANYFGYFPYASPGESQREAQLYGPYRGQKIPKDFSRMMNNQDPSGK